MNTKINAIVTHSGSFHADEIAAITLLSQFYLDRPIQVVDHLLKNEIISIVNGTINLESSSEGDVIPVIRTRDKEILDAALAAPETFVIDVGGTFEAQARNFDHHQRSMTKKWEDGTPFSSAGLIWEWLKNKGVLHQHLDEEVLMLLENRLIIPLDSTDNGLKVFEPAMVCEKFNRDSSLKVTNSQFIKALNYMNELVSNYNYEAVMEVNARYTIQEALNLREEGQKYIIFEEKPSGNSVAQMVKEMSNNEVVMFGVPGGGTQFSLISVPEDLDKPFSIQNPWPEEFRGLTDFEINPDGGKPIKVKFVHKSGFMGVIEGGPSDCERIAKMITSPTPKPSTSPPKMTR